MHSKSQHLPFYYFLAGLTLLRLIIAPQFGLGVDEAHYLLYGRYIDLSYFDHPPLVGWVQYIFISFLGENEFAARLGAIIIGTATLWMLYFFIFKITAKTSLALLGVLALSASFMFNALFVMLMPDTLLFVLIIPIIVATVALENDNSYKNWFMLGLLLGVAGLAKYTAILFIIPIVLYLLIKKRYKLFYTPKMLVGIIPALLLITPVLVWNIQNDWMSFSYQSNHVVGSNTINWNGFLQSLGAQFGAYSPFLSPLAFYGLYKALRSKNASLFLSGLFGLVLILFFTYASLYKTALPHWSALFYLLFIPIGVIFLWEKSSRWELYLKGAIGFGLLMSLLLYAELALKFVPQPDYQSLHRDIYGFDTIMKEANQLLTNTPKEALAVTHWSVASRALFYNAPYNSEVYLIDKRYDQFDIWQKGTPKGKDLLFINTHDFHTDVAQTMHCGSIQEAKTVDIMLNHNKVNTIHYIWCKNFEGIK